MTRQDFHRELKKYLYIEDMGMIDVILASIIANSMKIGDPVWLTLIGPSSGGKSQFIRPFSQGNPEFIHRVDDLTTNTMLSGQGMDNSLLGRIGGHGILSMDDLTVLFSKNPEQRGEILSQFRMIYDGYFSKSSGSRKETLKWEGYLGMIAGSTPSIYRYFNEVADMGERFISYRMKKIDVTKAVEFVSQNPHTSGELNQIISDLIREFIPPLINSLPDKSDLPPIHQETLDVIREVSQQMALLRTPIHTDDRTGMVDEFPEPEMPFRVMKQLTYLAQAMQCLCSDPAAPLSTEMTHTLQWTGYSLANDKRRAYLRSAVALEYQGKKITNRAMSSIVGLNTEVVRQGMTHLQALGILSLSGDEGNQEWSIPNRTMYKLIRQIDPVTINEDTIEYE